MGESCLDRAWHVSVACTLLSTNDCNMTLDSSLLFVSLVLVVPVYAIPFALGSQVDCYTTRHERARRKRGEDAVARDFSSHGVADMG